MSIPQNSSSQGRGPFDRQTWCLMSDIPQDRCDREYYKAFPDERPNDIVYPPTEPAYNGVPKLTVPERSTTQNPTPTQSIVQSSATTPIIVATPRTGGEDLKFSPEILAGIAIVFFVLAILNFFINPKKAD